MLKQIILVGALAISGAANAQVQEEVALDASCAVRSDALSNVCQLVNSERGRKGVNRLTLDARLTAIAQKFANDMHARGYFSHTSPEGSTMRSRLVNGGAAYGWAGENIARGQADSNEVVDDWMHSAGHRRNILQSKFRKLGVGRAGNVWVQVFTD